MRLPSLQQNVPTALYTRQSAVRSGSTQSGGRRPRMTAPGASLTLASLPMVVALHPTGRPSWLWWARLPAGAIRPGTRRLISRPARLSVTISRRGPGRDRRCGSPALYGSVIYLQRARVDPERLWQDCVPEWRSRAINGCPAASGAVSGLLAEECVQFGGNNRGVDVAEGAVLAHFLCRSKPVITTSNPTFSTAFAGSGHRVG
jgi:hypothetical protein